LMSFKFANHLHTGKFGQLRNSYLQNIAFLGFQYDCSLKEVEILSFQRIQIGLKMLVMNKSELFLSFTRFDIKSDGEMHCLELIQISNRRSRN
jgi:hypothetical protein